MNSLAPIILFVYNRPIHTEQTLMALMQNELAAESILYIYSDGQKDQAKEEDANKIVDVRKVIRYKQWCKEVHIVEFDRNKGLAKSIIEGVTEVITKHGKVIVLEDDLVTSKFFVRFMNEALSFYKTDNRIFSIGGLNYKFSIPQSYKHDVYIVHRTESCGWGTWIDRWEKAEWWKVEFSSLFLNKNEIKKFNRGGDDLTGLLQLQMDGKIDSWAIQWDYCHYKHNAFCLRPIKSFIRNIGFDGSGIHSDNVSGDLHSGNQYNKQYYDINFIKDIAANNKIEKNFKSFFGVNRIWIVQVLFKTKCFIKTLLIKRHKYEF
jgi:hypothetical protein